MISIAEICEAVWALEERYDLLQFQMQGVKPWQAQRWHIVSRLIVELGVMQAPHAPTSRSEKLFGFGQYLSNGLRRGSLNLKPRPRLIMAHPRSKYIDGQHIDIYTHDLERDLLQQGIPFYELDRGHHGVHLRPSAPFRIPLDDQVLLRKALRPLVHTSRRHDPRIAEFSQALHQALGVQLRLHPLFHHYVQRYLIEARMFKRLLQRVQPERIDLVVSYGDLAPLIASAKQLNIPVHELQHGTLSRYHMGYSFPNGPHDLDYFPDHFWAWSNFWKASVDWPISPKQVHVRPFAHQEQQIRRTAHLQRRPKQLLVLSQGSLTEAIAAQVLKHFKRFADWSIQYKLHPGEYNNWQDSPSLSTLAQRPNVQIHKDTDLAVLFAQSQTQLGVYSTALFEGHDFGCQTILLNLPGLREHMSAFITHYDVEVLN